jgi:hypothetical protein
MVDIWMGVGADAACSGTCDCASSVCSTWAEEEAVEDSAEEDEEGEDDDDDEEEDDDDGEGDEEENVLSAWMLASAVVGIEGNGNAPECSVSTLPSVT